jgi:glycosidase
MPWSAGPGAGFSSGRPWLRLGPDAAIRNVVAQRADPASVLSLYRRLIALRAATPALQVGDLRMEPADLDDVLAYTRTVADQTVLVALHLGRDAMTWRLPAVAGRSGWRVLVDSDGRLELDAVLPGGATIDLQADQAVILEGVD